MKFGRYFPAGAIFLALGSLFIAWLQHEARMTSDAVRARFESQSGEWQKRAAAAEQHARELEDQLAAQRSSAGSRAQEGTVPDPGSAAADEGNVVDKTLARMKEPKIGGLMSARTQAQLALRYAALFSELKLNREQGAKFMSLLVEKQSAGLDVVGAASGSGVSDMGEIGRMILKTQTDLNEQIRATLGDAGYAEYQNFSRTQALRDVVGALQSSLGPSSSPLTAAQYQQLVQILAQTGSRGAVASGSGADANSMASNAGSLITDATLAQAQTVLSPFQLKALKGLQRVQQIDRALKAQLAKPASRPSGSGG